MHERAHRTELEYGERRVAVYEWGSGPAVLLVHGWRSRASRLSAFVEALEGEYTVVAFDAPGNGDSAGDRTTALEYAAIVAMLSERFDGFHSIVGHSLGAVATVMAVRDFGARTGSIATITRHPRLRARARGVRVCSPGSRSTLRDESGPASSRWSHPIMGDPFRRLLTELPAELQVPMLVVHDRSDREVAPHQAERIAAAHPGARLMLTDGLGHARILRDPAVVDAVRDFVSARVRAAQATAA